MVAPSSAAAPAAPVYSSISLYNVEVESACLATLLTHPDSWPEFYLIGDLDWSPMNRPFYGVIKAQLGSTPPGSVTPVVLAERLKSYGITSVGATGLSPFEYMEALSIRATSKSEAGALAKELKRLSVRRALVEKADEIKRDLVRNPGASFEEMTRTVERGLSSITTEYHKPETTEFMGGMIDVIESRAAKPLSQSEAGFLGPFQSINETISSLSFPGAYVVIGARSASGKSSLGWFYNTHLLESYENLHVLHLDAAEMPYEELCWRAVCCLSKGRIPYWAVYRGEWQKNPEWAELVRGDLWPRVKRMVGRMSYKNIGSMSPEEQVSFIRRFYFNRVGRDSHLVIHYDYLKGLETFNSRQSEYQAIGNFVHAQKALITDELPKASIWTSVQSNRMGVVTGKRSDDVNESEETFSLSDRILQMSTHAFTLRWKLPEELGRENGGQYGNLKLVPLKKRQLVGERYEEMLRPVKTQTGRFVSNYVNLDTRGFYYEDRGLYSDMLKRLGLAKTDLAQTHVPDEAGL